MRKCLLTLAVAGLFAALAVTQALAAGYSNGILAENQPFSYLDVAGKPAGFDVEAMNWVANTMGFSVSHKVMAPDALLPGLLAGEADMVTGRRITPETLQQVAFSRPYCIVGNVFVTRDGSGLSEQDIIGGKKLLGVQRATPLAQWLARALAEERGNYTLQYQDYLPELFADLLAGKIDAIAMIAEQAEDAIHKDGKPVIIVNGSGPRDFLGVAVRPGETALLDSINEGYRRLRADPYWEELKQKHRVAGW